MAPTREQLLSVLSIARDHSGLRGGRGLSLRQLIAESDYRAVRARIEASLLSAILRAEPAIVDDWLAYSEDKRTSSGWAFWQSRGGAWVIGDLAGAHEEFGSREFACAEFVLRELDYWAVRDGGGWHW